jgi:hypothetical protein
VNTNEITTRGPQPVKTVELADVERALGRAAEGGGRGTGSPSGGYGCVWLLGVGGLRGGQDCCCVVWGPSSCSPTEGTRPPTFR